MICKMFIKILKNTIYEEHKILIVFDNMIADMISNKKQLNSVATELFNRGRKLIQIYQQIIH